MTRRAPAADSPARVACGPGLILCVCFVLGLLGPHEEVVANTGAAIGLCLWAAGSGGGARRGAALAVVAGLPLMLMLPTPEARLAAATGIVLVGRPVSPGDGLFTATVLAWQVVERHAPIAWSTLVELSRGISALAGTLTRQSLDLGPSATGLDLLLVSLLYAATHDRILGGALPVKVLLSGTAVLVHSALLPFLGSAAHSTGMAVAVPFSSTVAGAMFGWKAALLAVLCLIASLSAGIRRPGGASRPGMGACLALSALLAAGLADPETSAAQRRPGRIVFLKSRIADTSVPEHGRYGISRSGMFGLLPRYLALDGHLTTIHEGPLTRRIIDSASVLVVPLPVRSFAPEEAAAISTFVGRGGTVLVMGDHTDLLGIMKPLNDLTGPWGIHLRFDSAYPAVNRWRRCLSGSHAGHGRTGIGTGASLQIAPPARPLLVARYALSDAGDRSNAGGGAYLGNYAFDAGERLGDLVVAAVARHGEGRVVVFGDTSSFQNVQLPSSYPFVAALMSELAGPADRAPWKDPMVAILAAALAALSLAGTRAAAAGIACAVMAGSALTALLSEAPPLDRLPSRAPVALIDSAHLNGYSRSLWHTESLGGLLVGLQRDGFLPLMVEDRLPAGPWGGSALPVLVEPRRPLARAELLDLRSHLESGGDFIVAVGSQGGRNLDPLLAPYGISIGSLPLGPHPIRPDMDESGFQQARRSPQFRRAHPVLTGDPLAVRSHYKAFGRDVVLELRSGAGGRLIVLADPDFLTDGMLENEHGAWEGNVSFLSRLLHGRRG